MTDEEVRKAFAYLKVFKDCRHPVLDGDPCLPSFVTGKDAVEREIREKTRSTLDVWDKL